MHLIRKGVGPKVRADQGRRKEKPPFYVLHLCGKRVKRLFAPGGAAGVRVVSFRAAVRAVSAAVMRPPVRLQPRRGCPTRRPWFP
jgi:hypothetical protein